VEDDVEEELSGGGGGDEDWAVYNEQGAAAQQPGEGRAEGAVVTESEGGGEGQQPGPDSTGWEWLGEVSQGWAAF
jgi:hypothetical protein